MAASPSGAQVLDRNLWGPDGAVTAMARAGNTLYIAGGFSTIGRCTGGGVPLDRETAAPRRGFPRITGTLRAMVPDGSGGWFIGGRFTAVEGRPRTGLAHVLADGSVTAWAPVLWGYGHYVFDPDRDFRYPGVSALVLRGNVLYAGGLFITVDGRTRNNLAAFDVRTGALLDWDPDTDTEVLCLALSGNLLYLGGDFTIVGGQPRNCVAAVDATTGAVTTWNPRSILTAFGTAPGSPGQVRALVVSGRTVYAGGDFDAIGGQPRNSVAALDAVTGEATEWDAGLQPHRQYIAHGDWYWPYVAALAVRGKTVYLGGGFDAAGGRRCRSLAALDATTARPTRFDAAIDAGSVYALALRGGVLYAGGYLYDIGGAVRPNLAALDAGTGEATAWNPRPNGWVGALGTDDSTVYVGGGFTSIYDWKLRFGRAALDLTTGEATDWYPSVTGTIEALLVRDDTLYLGGSFSSVDGQPRRNLAAMDARTGTLTPWSPDVDGAVRALTSIDSTLYFAGFFQSVAGRARNGLAAVDARSGVLRPWDPRLPYPRPWIDVIAARGATVYVGGSLYSARGDTVRDYLVALDGTTAVWSPWNPIPGPPYPFNVQPVALVPDGDRVYIGGNFDAMGGQPRSGIAAVDTLMGNALPWDPEARGPSDNYRYLVGALAVRGDLVYAGGQFTSIGGKARHGLAALDASSRQATAWDPNPDGGQGIHPLVDALLISDDVLYVGGEFTTMSGVPCSRLAAFTLPAAGALRRARPAAGAAAAPRVADARVLPNPVRSRALVRLVLPASASVSLRVYDLQGRRVATLLDRAERPAGTIEIPLVTRGWRPGLYLCRVEAGDFKATRKFVVAR